MASNDDLLPVWIHSDSFHGCPARLASFPPPPSQQEPRQAAPPAMWHGERAGKLALGMDTASAVLAELRRSLLALEARQPRSALARPPGRWGPEAVHAEDPVEDHEEDSLKGARGSEEATAMAVIKNLPSRCREEEVLELIEGLGFRDDVVDFGMPMRMGKSKRVLNRGYAFVYFSDELVCMKFVEAAAGCHGFGERVRKRPITVHFSPHISGRSTSSAPDEEPSPRAASSAGGL